MNTAPLSTERLDAPVAQTSVKPVYLNSRFGARRPASKSAVGLLNEMMATPTTGELPVTSTLRLLEVSCGLKPDDVERLLIANPGTSSSPVAEPVPRRSFYDRFAAIGWTLLLTLG